MPLAKGTLSSLLYKLEATYGDPILVNGSDTGFRYCSFINEALGGSINEVVSEEIRPDRAIQAIRGGNISANGTITTEFGPLKNGLFMAHLMGIAIPAKTNKESSLLSGAGAVAYDRGCIAKNATDVFQCIKAGTTAAGGVAALDSDLDVQTSGSSMWKKCGLLDSGILTGITAIAYNLGDLGKNSTNVFRCTQAGTCGASGLDALDSGLYDQTSGSTTWRNLGVLANFEYGQYLLEPSATTFVAPGLAFEKRIVGATSSAFIQFDGCRIGSMALNLPQEGMARADWNIIAKTQYNAVGAAQTTPEAAQVDNPFTGADCGVFIKSGMGQTMFAPTTAANSMIFRPVREATLNIDNQFDESVFVIGERYRREVPPGVRRISGSFTTYFEDDTEFVNFLGESELTVQFFMQVGAHLMLIKLTACKLTGSGTPVISGPGVLTMTYNFTAYKGVSNQSDISIELWSPGVMV